MKKMVILSLLISVVFFAHSAEQKKEAEDTIDLAISNRYSQFPISSSDKKMTLQEQEKILDEKLEEAISSNDIKTAKNLLHKGARFPKRRLTGAIVEFVNILLMYPHFEQINVVNDLKNKIDMAEFLIEAGADVNYRFEKDNKTPLIDLLDLLYDVETDFTETDLDMIENMIKMLINHGADVQAVDSDGHSAMYYARRLNLGLEDLIEKAFKLKQGEELWECDKNWRNIHEENP